jgi:hypothetical protein
MNPAIRFYRDQTHQPAVQAIPEYQTLAEYLASDIQDSGTGREVLAALDNTAARGEQELSGNAYTALISTDQVVLESLYDEEEESHRLPTEQFRLLLNSWITFLDNEGLLSLVPEF